MKQIPGTTLENGRTFGEPQCPQEALGLTQTSDSSIVGPVLLLGTKLPDSDSIALREYMLGWLALVEATKAESVRWEMEVEEVLEERDTHFEQAVLAIVQKETAERERDEARAELATLRTAAESSIVIPSERSVLLQEKRIMRMNALAASMGSMDEDTEYADEWRRLDALTTLFSRKYHQYYEIRKGHATEPRHTDPADGAVREAGAK